MQPRSAGNAKSSPTDGPAITPSPAPAENGQRGAGLVRSVWLGLSRLADRVASHPRWRVPVLVLAEAGFAGFSVASSAAFIHSGEFWNWSPLTYGEAFLLAAIQLGVGALTGAFGVRWRYVGMRDAVVIVRSGALSGILGYGAVRLVGDSVYALRFVASAAAVYVLFSSGIRLLIRYLHEWARRTAAKSVGGVRRAVVIGAGEAGSALIKSLLASPKQLTEPVAVVDDDRHKHGMFLHGVPIVGAVDQLSSIALEHQAAEIIIAIPSATAEQIGRVVDACLAARIPFLIAPDPEDPLGNGAGRSALRVVQPADLLGRPAVNLNVAQMRAELGGARVVVTGGAGSIGSELARQLVKLQPAGLWLIDRNENDLYFLRGELDAQRSGVPHVEIIRDVRNEERMARILRQLRPTHVFHAAAFKHVPLMELYPVSAVENNILGTWSVLRAAMAAGARKFVLISTDKAVEPSSVMGATKRFAEMLVSEVTRGVGMAGVIVRFGNVLGSNGSVVPLFQRQIAAGGPVTLTSREATRYFMTTAEAAQLVLQATSLPDMPGKIAILDMGTPVRIADLAERLIALSGFRPGVDIEIVETGLRPGEKLHERLWWESERAEPSSHPKISLANAPELPGGAAPLIPEICGLIEAEDGDALRALLERTTGLCSPSGAAPADPALPAQPRDRDVPGTAAAPAATA